MLSRAPCTILEDTRVLSGCLPELPNVSAHLSQMLLEELVASQRHCVVMKLLKYDCCCVRKSLAGAITILLACYPRLPLHSFPQISNQKRP